MFRIQNGRVNYRSRFVRNERYLAQEKAGKILFPMYRNPVHGRSQRQGPEPQHANTHIIHHRDMLLALKEDSPPAAMDLLHARDTRDPIYTFDGTAAEHRPFTAHPKTRFATPATCWPSATRPRAMAATPSSTCSSITPQGKQVWNAKVSVPYVGMLHDFAVTEHFVAFLRDSAGLSTRSRWRAAASTGPGTAASPRTSATCAAAAMARTCAGSRDRARATHVMGCFDDGKHLYVDVRDVECPTRCPFMPHARWLALGSGARRQPHHARCRWTLRRRNPKDYDIETHVSAHRRTAAPGRSLQHRALPLRLPALPGSGSGDPLQNNNCVRALRSPDATGAAVTRARPAR